MVTLGLEHIGHGIAHLASAVHLPQRTRTAVPAVLTLLGFTPLQVEVLIGGFAVTLQQADTALLRLKGHLPNCIAPRQSLH